MNNTTFQFEVTDSDYEPYYLVTLNVDYEWNDPDENADSDIDYYGEKWVDVEDFTIVREDGSVESDFDLEDIGVDDDRINEEFAKHFESMKSEAEERRAEDEADRADFY